MNGSEGFWSSYGAPASVDWCEPNYTVVPWIAEWFNVISSAPMLIVGLIALYKLYRAPWRTEPRFALCFGGLAFVGAGSMAFHGTLLHVAQALDELPMVYCSLVMAYCVVVRNRRPEDQADRVITRRWQAGFTAYGIAFTGAYLLTPEYFTLFIVSFAGVVTYVVLRGWYVVFRLSNATALRRMYLVAAGAFVAAVFLFWIPERNMGCNHPLQSLQPHAWFHILAMIGTYVGFLVVIYDRFSITERSPTMRWWRLPWVSPKH